MTDICKCGHEKKYHKDGIGECELLTDRDIFSRIRKCRCRRFRLKLSKEEKLRQKINKVVGEEMIHIDVRRRNDKTKNA